MTTILGVHGVNNWDRRRPPEAAAVALAESWATALGAALPGTPPWRLEMAYYAHHLRREQAQGIDDPETLDAELREDLSEWAMQLPRPEEVAQGFGTLPPRQAIAFMARWGGFDSFAVGAFVAVFLREVRTYFRRRAAREAARAEVATAIRRTGARIVLAHSLGSVVVHEALAADPDLEIDLLITMGSPLGIRRLVRDRLEPAGCQRDRLPNVARWVNVADPGDLCAIPRWLGKTFVGVDEDIETPVHAFKFHDADLYLRTGPVTARLRERLAHQDRRVRKAR